MKTKSLCALFIAALLVVTSVSVAGAAPANSPAAGPLAYGSNCIVVRAGDNLYRISLRLGVSMYTLMQANGISNPNRIYAGQVLCVSAPVPPKGPVYPPPPRPNCNQGNAWIPECQQPQPLGGWRGEYFNNERLAGGAAFIRYDSAINFNWGWGSPDARLSPTCFSARWTRTVWFGAGTYRFTTTTDDGVRLWVDDALVIDQWLEQPAASYSADVSLSAGNHNIRMEYFQLKGLAQAQLSWQLASSSCSSCGNNCASCGNNCASCNNNCASCNDNCPSCGGTGNVITTGSWFGQYYDNMFLQGGPTFTRTDADVNFDWGISGPGAGIEGSLWSARWTQRASFAGGKYRLHAVVDDGVRVFVDGKIVMDHWEDNPGYEHLSDVSIAGGSHEICVEYFQRGHEAKIRVWWEKIG